MIIWPPQISMIVPGFPCNVKGLFIIKECNLILSCGNSMTSPNSASLIYFKRIWPFFSSSTAFKFISLMSNAVLSNLKSSRFFFIISYTFPYALRNVIIKEFYYSKEFFSVIMYSSIWDSSILTPLIVFTVLMYSFLNSRLHAFSVTYVFTLWFLVS